MPCHILSSATTTTLCGIPLHGAGWTPDCSYIEEGSPLVRRHASCPDCLRLYEGDAPRIKPLVRTSARRAPKRLLIKSTRTDKTMRATDLFDACTKAQILADPLPILPGVVLHPVVAWQPVLEVTDSRGPHYKAIFLIGACAMDVGIVAWET